ncbi:TIGR03086 family protein [Streptomyces armeniacus]|uniref:TIGR03086 family protein n=1 Tax=Streptomyces armeniacus TaxID=83291 RepID=A0A345XQ40_9ACTN|nr:TIGR03086 family metal-binding protein [Streptomyces armeniacus]AXK33756.1 TIGR03086 family protein [Streptomyces armeniacus]
MTHTISELFGAAAARAVPVVRGVPDERLGGPTPCAEYDVRALLNHLFAVVVNFQAYAVKEDADFSETPDRLHGGWREEFAREAARLAEAWAAPGAEDGVAGQMAMPARTVASLALLDLTVHPWDLARATGAYFTPDDACVAELEKLLGQLGPLPREMKVFGEPVPVGDGASAFDRLLAATGRDPAWTPPAGG